MLGHLVLGHLVLGHQVLWHQVQLGFRLRFRCQLQEQQGSFLQLAEQLEFRWWWLEPQGELREEPEPQLV